MTPPIRPEPDEVLIDLNRPRFVRASAPDPARDPAHEGRGPYRDNVPVFVTLRMPNPKAPE